MGLDAVELTMKVERCFGIEIPDREAERIRTAADLYAYVLRELDRDQILDPACPSRSGFYRLRRALVQSLGVPRRAVRRRARLEELLPRGERRRAWEQLSRLLNVALPPLRRPFDLEGWLMGFVLFIATGGALACAAGAFLIEQTEPFVWIMLWLGSVMLAIFIASAIIKVTGPLAVCIPSRCATVEAAVGYFTEVRGERAAHGATPAELWLTLRRILFECSGTEEEKIRPETRLFQDLL